MPTVFNTQTNLPDYVDDKSVDGKTYVPLTNQKINMVDAKGVVHTVLGSGLDAALDGGWKLDSTPKTNTAAQQVEEQKQQRINALVEEEDDPLSVGLKHFSNEALMGVPDIISEHTDSEEQKQANRILDEKHPIASTVGGVAGFGTSLLYGGEIAGGIGHLAERGVLGLGERAAEDVAANAITTSVTKRVLASAAKDAATAAAFSAPQAIAQASYGDDKQAAETILWAAGLGGTIGGGLGLGKAALGGIASSGVVGEFAGKLGDKLEASRLGLSPADVTSLGKDKVSNIFKQVAKAGETGNKLGPEDFLKQKDAAWKEIEGHTSYLDDALKKMQADPEKAVPDLMSKQNIISNIRSTISDRYKVLDSPLFAGQRKILDDALEHINNEKFGQNLTFNEGFDILRKLSEKTEFGEEGHSKPLNAMRKQIGGLFSDWINGNAGKVFASTEGGADREAQYLASKKNFGAWADLLDKGVKEGDEMKFTQPGVLQNFLGNRVGGAVSLGSALTAVGVPAPIAYPLGYYGMPLLKRLADDRLSGMTIRGLRKIADNPETAPYLGSMIAKTTVDALSKHIDAIPDMIKTAAKVAPLAAINPIKSYLGDRSSGLSKDQQYKKVSDEITAAASNPAYATQEIGKLISVFGDSPQLATLIANKHNVAIQYLYNALPKNPNPQLPYQTKEWEATTQQKADFAQKLAVIENPLVAIHKIALGTISTNEIETMKAIYPEIYGSFVNRIVSHGYAPERSEMPYHQKVAVSKFIGVPLDKSLEPANAKSIQNSFAPQQSEPKGSPSKMKPLEVETSTQKLSNKGISK